MRTEPNEFKPEHRLIGVVATIVAHVALGLFWWMARHADSDGDGKPAPAIQWVKMWPKRAVEPHKVAVASSAKKVTHKKPVEARAPLAAPAPPPQERAPEQTPSEPTAPAPAVKSAYDIMQQARRDIGKIDKEVKKEFPEQHIKKPLDTPQARLEKGIELANELAPPKWYEPAKVKELIDPGGYGRRRYRIITAHGTFCMTYESAHSPDGRDQATRSTAPKMTNCPDHEEPAKEQKW